MKVGRTTVVAEIRTCVCAYVRTHAYGRTHVRTGATTNARARANRRAYTYKHGHTLASDPIYEYTGTYRTDTLGHAHRLYDAQCTVYNVKLYTVCIVQCILFNAHCTMYTVHCTQIIIKYAKESKTP